jgi:MFS family permease
VEERAARQPSPYRAARPVLTALSLLMVGFGLLTSLMGVRATLEGFSTQVIGLIGSAYYAGFMAGALAGPRLVARVGHVRVFAAAASVIAAAIAVLPFSVDPVVWTLVRLVVGLGVSALYLVAESWLNSVSTEGNRGRLLSVYLVTANLGFGAGQLLFAVSDPEAVAPFVAVSAIYSLSVLPVTLSATAAPAHALEEIRLPLRAVLRSAPLAPATSAVSGLGVSIVLGLGAFYGIETGMTVDEVARVMIAAMVGGVVLQWPLGWLSDHFPRRLVILATTSASGIVALLGLAAPDASLAVMVVVAGYTALSFPLYSMAISHMNDVIPSRLVVAASAVLILSYGLGSVSGPYLASLAIDLWGIRMFWVALAISHLALVPYLAYRLVKRPVVLQRRHYKPIAPEATPSPGLLVEEMDS